MTPWYRYDVQHYAAPLDETDISLDSGLYQLVLYEYPVAKETAQGVWLLSARRGAGRFVLKSSRKRYACPTKEEALASFIRRKEVQISILTAQLRTANLDLSLARTGIPTVLSMAEFEFTVEPA